MFLHDLCRKSAESYPLPQIDQLVDSMVGYGFIFMLDAFQGYNQVPLARAYQDKVSFITSYDMDYYRVMSFGLKNVSATYQRLMNHMF